MDARRYEYPAREPGTRSWLKNHRRMLSHMRTKAELDLAEAESAFTEAESAYQRSGTSVNAAQLEIATKKRRDKQRNLSWQYRKREQLDRHGIVLMDNGDTPRELDSVEREWNELDSMKH